MSWPLVGALVGLAFAAAEYVLFGALIERAARRGETGRGPRILELLRRAQLIVYPLVGWLLGWWIAENSGVS